MSNPNHLQSLMDNAATPGVTGWPCHGVEYCLTVIFSLYCLVLVISSPLPLLMRHPNHLHSLLDNAATSRLTGWPYQGVECWSYSDIQPIHSLFLTTSSPLELLISKPNNLQSILDNAATPWVVEANTRLNSNGFHVQDYCVTKKNTIKMINRKHLCSATAPVKA